MFMNTLKFNGIITYVALWLSRKQMVQCQNSFCDKCFSNGQAVQKNSHIFSLKNIIKISRNMENSKYWYMVSLLTILKAHTCNLWIVFKRIILSYLEKTFVKLSDIDNNTCRPYKYV